MHPLIEDILKKQTITEYLSSKGIEPDRKDAKKAVYCCPSPDHDDSTPSFIVYAPDSDCFERFKCFGCGIHGNLIDIHRILEGFSLGQSIKNLGSGIHIDSDRELQDVIKQFEQGQDKDNYDLDDYALLIARLVNQYLLQVNFNDKEVEFVDKVLMRVDDMMQEMDIESIEKTYNFLADVGFSHRQQMLENKLEAERVSHAN